ncbi:hypothetical protein M758_UG191500 [Ceratodon purpureus]|nr:hypothetical protein M758_UG191500 [Ceratodon purpureus]
MHIALENKGYPHFRTLTKTLQACIATNSSNTKRPKSEKFVKEKPTAQTLHPQSVGLLTKPILRKFPRHTIIPFLFLVLTDNLNQQLAFHRSKIETLLDKKAYP